MNNKIIKSILWGIALGIGLLTSCQSKKDARESVLKIYNWGDYIDENVLEEFPIWYKEQTGEEVKIIYQVFDINEIMLTKIARGKEDFDLVCPSDYIIERMMNMDLLQPIQRDFGNTPDYTQNIAPYIDGELNKLSKNGKKTTDYAVPYMWGTTGILYNKTYVPEGKVKSWECLWNPEFKGKILMKDSYRDAYCATLIYANREKLAKGEATVNEVINDYSAAAIDTAEVYLKRMKPLLAGWEADFGKEMMTKSKVWMNLTWSGDAQWAIEEAGKVGTELEYIVPQEGSTVWYDGWAIPKYARNPKAASYFLNYLCRPDIAIRNMNTIGYVSAVAGAEIMEQAQDSTLANYSDVSYFFGEAGKNIKVNHTMYPDIKVIERCAMQRDFGDHTENVLDMWSSVKGDNLNPWILTVIFLTILLLLFGGIYSKYRKYRHHKAIRILKSRRKRKS